jgi:hypothetical protein
MFLALQALVKPNGRVFLFRSSHFAVTPVPPFILQEAMPLVHATRTELVVLLKTPMFHVEQKH